jgi:tRNA pseudouridine55 synthase
MDGVLVIDKPRDLTSHDVVVHARRALAERRIGHTGTLDPLATGVLPLVCGRATRLARFLTASEKDYDATIRFGVTTDSFDIEGTQTSRSGRVPHRGDLVRVLESLVGSQLQTPPAYSAKKIAGRRAYELARHDVLVTLRPVEVRLSHVELLDFDDERARVLMTCSAGFYVRAFAHTLGERLGTGACLEALRRTRSGEFTVDNAVSLESLERDSVGRQDRLVPLERLLLDLPAVRVTDEGRVRISHGRQLDSVHLVPPAPQDRGSISQRPGPVDPPHGAPSWVRLLDREGSLLALGTPGRLPGSLHPSVVLI